MLSRSALVRPAVLLLWAVVPPSSNGWNSKTQFPEPESHHLVLVRRYVPGAFNQSALDRLSGGLAQRFPYRMAVDSRGRVLVTDPGLSVVHVFDTRQGKRWQISGGMSRPAITSDYKLGRCSLPSLITDGGVLVRNIRVSFVHVFDTRQAKIRGDRLIMPAFVATDGDDNVYVTDLKHLAVLVFQPDGRFIRTIGLGVFALPTGIAVDKQNRKLYVADGWQNEILLFSLEGKLLQSFGTSGAGPGQLQGPLDVVLRGDTVIVRDTGNSRLQVFDLKGNYRGIRPYGGEGTPVAFTFDAVGNLYYSDWDSGGLIAMDPDGKVLAKFDAHRNFGQWSPRTTRPNFVGVATDQRGDVLALRPNLTIEVVRISGAKSSRDPR